MTNSHRKLIKFCEKNSLLRLYAQLTKLKEVKLSYNSAVNAYAKFNEKHSYYVPHYIEKRVLKTSPEIDVDEIKGTNNVPHKFIK